ncbi:hypothetical protein LJ725_06615 [Reyranella aquatilis]|uniref:PepSY domain-containing protein n=1 Tax=Reyranella aquatilis TaxID=2035356 RepID=A0ABS8KRF7_9HYPH|nr:hypothetical protein [Reyranella aquatilis]MCC8428629.1 hypothetical protein [Reyranella aquatilis]
MKRTLLVLSLAATAVLATNAVQAQGMPSGPEPAAEPGSTRMPTAAPNWTPTAEGAIARQQIHDAGYNGVSMLMRNSDGSWQGQALKGDTYYRITLDPQGHVTQR